MGTSELGLGIGLMISVVVWLQTGHWQQIDEYQKRPYGAAFLYRVYDLRQFFGMNRDALLTIVYKALSSQLE